jgi:UDP-glucose 4-epimerase
MSNRFVVTGCAGFIGSSMVDRLLSQGHEVIGIDNFSTGVRRFLSNALDNKDFTLEEKDLLDLDSFAHVFKDVDTVFHFSANADVRSGLERPRVDLEQNTIVTHNVLEAMRLGNVKRIVFSSTGSVYGEAVQIPTPEDVAFPIQTSLYAASKVSCEGMISAYCEGFEFQAWIFRFVSILGERYTHGHVFDFYEKLNEDSSTLPVLGNGKQRKSYLYIQDCLDAVQIAMKNSHDKVNIFNLGVDDFCEVNDSIGWICDELGVAPDKVYSGGDRGWVGDNPFIFLDTKKITALGWSPKFTIEEGVRKTVKFLKENEWVFGSRGD